MELDTTTTDKPQEMVLDELAGAKRKEDAVIVIDDPETVVSPSVPQKKLKLSKEEREAAKKKAMEEKEKKALLKEAEKKQQAMEKQKKMEEKLEEQKRKAETKRIEHEKKEAEAKKKAEAKRLEQEKREADAKQKAEAKRIEQEKKEAEAKQKAEAKRLETERKEAEARRKEELAEQNKISRFFRPVKRATPDLPISSDPFEDFFKPFFVKPSVIVAPANHFYSQNLVSNEETWDFRDAIKRRRSAGVRERKFTNLIGLDEGDSMPVAVQLIKFHDNIRPAFYGRNLGKSQIIKGRKPLAKDTDFLDYEIDSDEEWEDEGEGESVGSDCDSGESDLCSEEEDDDGWLVPHGYLSPDEGDHDEDGEKDEIQPRKKVSSESFKPIIIEVTGNESLASSMRVIIWKNNLTQKK